MVLSSQQVIERIRSPLNSIAIQEADRHQQRVKLHAQAIDDKNKAPAYFADFLSWVQNGIGLPSDKMQVFKALCSFPLPTTSLCDSIFLELQKVFSAQDSYFDVELRDDSMKQHFSAYLEKNNIRTIFKEKAFAVHTRRPCDLFVVDLPGVQTSLRPEPYFYTVAVSDIQDISVEYTSGGNRISFVVFKSGKNFIAIDDAFYRVFLKQDDADDYMLRLEVPHPLGYTPATFLPPPLYDQDDSSFVARKAILSPLLTDLEWLLFYKVAERCYETYGPFPIMTVPSSGKCDYTDSLGQSCSGGIVATTNSHGHASHYNCPVCKKNSLVGPGTIYERTTPRTKEDPILPNAIDITTPDIPSLDYITKKIDFLEWELYANAVGSADETMTKEAVNQKQVMVSVEGKKNVLQSFKKDFERCEKFLIDTIGRLMYGDYYVTATVNYGEQWMLYTAAEVVEQFQTYKKAGLPNYMIARKKQLLIQTENKNNPYGQRRSEILDMLEPWPDMSTQETVNLQLSTIFKEKFALKLDFAKFVSKFELVNGDIVQWGILLNLDEKIKRIEKILNDYVKQELKTATNPVESGASNTGANQTSRTGSTK